MKAYEKSYQFNCHNKDHSCHVDFGFSMIDFLTELKIFVEKAEEKIEAKKEAIRIHTETLKNLD